MQYVKYLFAFLLVLLIGAVSSAANVPPTSAEKQEKSEVQDRLLSATKIISKKVGNKPATASDRYSQWYNWNNWGNWSNWSNYRW